VSEPTALTLAQVAARAGISPATVRRWVRQGLVPQYERSWTLAAATQVRIIARLRSRGYTLTQIRRANDSGALASYVQGMFTPPEGRYTIGEAAQATGLEPDLIERMLTSLGLTALSRETLSDQDVDMVRSQAAVLAAGFPPAALVQLMRVYGQALAQIADAEVRLFHLHVHEPLMRQGVPGAEIAANMEGLARDTLPFAVPLMSYLHGLFLGHFVEEDVIDHMEADLGELPEGHLRVAIAFADLAGYAQLTEERGDEGAVSVVERFLDVVEYTLPVDARVIKTLGDEVMVVSSDATALTAWAIALQARTASGEPPPRIGIHHGQALYRDGDYYGRDVNEAARVAARAEGGEVLVTRPVVELATGVDGMQFRRIGKVELKGFSKPTELFAAFARPV
jgi:adenylate cyclase